MFVCHYLCLCVTTSVCVSLLVCVCHYQCLCVITSVCVSVLVFVRLIFRIYFHCVLCVKVLLKVEYLDHKSVLRTQEYIIHDLSAKQVGCVVGRGGDRRGLEGGGLIRISYHPRRRAHK